MSLALSPRRAILMPGPWVRDELWRRARAVPSLDLRFADSKSLIDVISGLQLITFTRASSGTFVGSGGLVETAGTNVPRFDHNPITGECLGLLVEEQRTNLLLQSEDVTATWTSFGGLTRSLVSEVAPNGVNSCSKLAGDGVSFGYIEQSTAPSNQFTSGTTYTFSVYLKKANTSTAQTLLYGSTFNSGGANPIATWNLDTGVPTFTNGATGSMTPVGNGWYRCAVTDTATQTETRNHQWLRMASQLGDVLLWGAQLEAEAFPTSYIPTTTAAVTRSAEPADIISSAIANNIRTLYVEFRSPASGTRGIVSLNDNTANQRASVITSGTDPRLVVVDGGVEQANIDGGTATANARTRVAVRINPSDFSISVNGGAVVTDTSGTLPTVDRLMLGRTNAGEYLNGTLARVTGWTGLVPDSTLQTLTR